MDSFKFREYPKDLNVLFSGWNALGRGLDHGPGMIAMCAIHLPDFWTGAREKATECAMALSSGSKRRILWGIAA